MKNDASQSEGKKKNRRLAVLASLLLLIPIGVFGGVFYQQRLAAMHQYPDRRPWDDPQVAAAMRKVRLTQAQALRDRYGKWAEQHQDGLKKLLRSKDPQALLAWYQATDASKPNGPISDTDPDAGKRGYTWDADKERLWKSIRLGTLDAKSVDIARDAMKHNFISVKADYTRYGDYRIARSLSIGPESTSIWASGRVTLERIIDNPVRQNGAPSFVEVEPEEVVPAFDFLK